MTVTDGTGCIVSIEEIIVDKSSSVNDIDLDEVDVFPNPVRSTLDIESKELNINSLELFDLRGKRVYSNYDLDSQNNCQINVQLLDEGVYFLKVNTEKAAQIRRITVIR